MSILFTTATASELACLTSVPQGDMCFGTWLYWTSDTGTNTPQHIFSLFNGANVDFPAELYIEGDLGSETATLKSYENGTTTLNEVAFPSRPALNTWAYWSIQVSGTDLIGRWREYGVSTWTRVTMAISEPAGQSMDVMLMAGGFLGGLNARAQNTFVAYRAYTDAELLTQSKATTIATTTSIHSFMRNTSAGNAGVDFSGNGRDWSVTGLIETAESVSLPDLDIYNVTAAFHVTGDMRSTAVASMGASGSFRVTESVQVLTYASLKDAVGFGFTESIRAQFPTTITESVNFSFTQDLQGSFPTSVACAGMDFFGWQGVWLGGFKQQQEANITSVTYNESVGFHFSQGLDIINTLEIDVVGSLNITKELSTVLFGNIYDEDVGFGMTNHDSVGAGFGLANEVSFRFTQSLVAQVEGGCGPREQWSDVADGTTEEWNKGPC